MLFHYLLLLSIFPFLCFFCFLFRIHESFFHGEKAICFVYSATSFSIFLGRRCYHLFDWRQTVVPNSIQIWLKEKHDLEKIQLRHLIQRSFNVLVNFHRSLRAFSMVLKLNISYLRYIFCIWTMFLHNTTLHYITLQQQSNNS